VNSRLQSPSNREIKRAVVLLGYDDQCDARCSMTQTGMSLESSSQGYYQQMLCRCDVSMLLSCAGDMVEP
jgi:hypothetical protein